MTTALRYAAPEFQEPILPSSGFLYRQPSSAVPCGHQREPAQQGASASRGHTAPKRVLGIRMVSSVSLTVVDIADLAVVDAERLVADDAVVVRELNDIPEIDPRLAPEGDWLRLDENALNDVAGSGCAFNFRSALHHDQSPCFVDLNIGPLALSSQAGISA